LRQTVPILLAFVLVALGIASGMDRFPQDDSAWVDTFGPLGPGEEAILFAGDTNLGGSTPVRYKFKYEGHDWMSRKLLPTLQSAHAAAFVVNLEAPVTRHKRKGKGAGSWHYAIPPKMLDGLQIAGITHVGLANNHMLDRRRVGLDDTFKHLTKANIGFFGAGQDLDGARAPLLLEVGGARVAIVGGMEPWKRRREAGWGATSERSGVLLFDKEGIPAAIAAARAQADLVIAFPHWGGNYKADIEDAQRRIARRLLAAGVDAIVGHHNHGALAFGSRDGVPVLWGLGNLFFGTQGRFGHDKMQPGYGLLARMVLEGGSIDRFELIPIRINNRLQDYQPRPCTRSDAEGLLRLLARQGVTQELRDEAREAGTEPINEFFHVDDRGVGILRVAR
jgi:poly-gamma-glutamate synthesis protein (capsule biosynthesis protein)